MSGIPKRDLLPIDETEDFQDPFSDLRLFLASKIKHEVTRHESPKKWSSKIQTEIIKKILPEFSSKFPMYRLGATALKKIWEKVSYYYGKMSKEAIAGDGKLDIEYVIRENLRELPIHTSGLPPYTVSHQLALKISECVATLDGVRPDLDQLTRKIWSVHKHLIPNLAAQDAKSPSEAYDLVDKLILKSMLESSSGLHYYTPKQLANKVKETFRTYSDIATLAEEHSITTIVFCLLANKSTLDIPYQDDIAEFISRQLETLPLNPELSLDANCLDIVSRILSLYPIASSLPMTITEEEIFEATDYIHSLLSGEPFEVAPPIDGALFLFIQAELQVLRGTELFDDLEKLQDYMLESYFQALTLPQLDHQEPLEILTWLLIDYHVGVLSHIPTPLLSAIEHELQQAEIDHDSFRFTAHAKQTAGFFKKVAKVSLGSDETLQRIDLWALQNEMATRYLYFDTSAPLYQHILSEWKAQNVREYTVDHAAFVRHVCETYEGKGLPHALEARVWILYRHIWYTEFANKTETTHMRFLKWHAARYSQLSHKELSSKLERISREALPLTPLQK